MTTGRIDTPDIAETQMASGYLGAVDGLQLQGQPGAQAKGYAMGFGGDWTAKKLDALKGYLDAYTTALKRQRFRLVYIDAFAGSGTIELGGQGDEFGEIVAGSARLAVEIRRRQFDRLVFVEKDAKRCSALEELRTSNPTRDIRIKQGDANEVLQELDLDWSNWRGVLFVDPFATQVQWPTIEKIASLKAS